MNADELTTRNIENLQYCHFSLCGDAQNKSNAHVYYAGSALAWKDLSVCLLLMNSPAPYIPYIICTWFVFAF